MSLVDLSQGGNNNLQNLRYYANAAEGAVEFSRNNRERQELNYLLRPLDVYVVNPLTDIVTDKIALPTLKSLYYLLGTSTVFTVKCVNGSYAQKIENALYDPLSTESLYNLGNRIQRISLDWSRRSPVRVSIIEYADTCSIVAARHIYIFASDMNAILQMPTKLRHLADEVCVAADEEIVQPLVRDGVEYGRSFVQSARNDQQAIEDTSSRERKLIQDSKDQGEICSEVEESSEQGVWGYWNSVKSSVKYYAKVGTGFATAASSKIGGIAAQIALNGVRKHAHDVINQNEKKVRQKIVGTAVHSVCRTVLATCVRGVVRGGAVVVCNKLMEHVIVAVIPDAIPNGRAIAQTTSLCITVAGTVLWLKCLSPTASRLNRSYNERFDSESSTIRELTSLVGQQNIDQLVNKVTTSLNGYIPENSYLGNFSQRVANIRIDAPFESPSRLSDLNGEQRGPIIEEVESDEENHQRVSH